MNVFWFRRDLRLQDHRPLKEALSQGLPVLPIFIFDPQILDPLPKPIDHRVMFIYRALEGLHEKLRNEGSQLHIFYGQPIEIFTHIFERWNVASVFTGEDYEPYAVQRDQKIEVLCRLKGIDFNRIPDHVIQTPDAVLKDDRNPYTVFTPYSKRWLHQLKPEHLASFDLPTQPAWVPASAEANDWVTLADMGFKDDGSVFPEPIYPDEAMKNYGDHRNYPGMSQSTSRLGVHLRFGTISIRSLARRASSHSSVFLNELIWRDFYQMILHHFPHVAKRSFKPAYDRIPWVNREDWFKRWCEGTTGYPMVDAGMRELNSTGFMHNRARMITASFLTKHLLIDWRWGESYFAEKLLDFELASNNGGWQWAAGSGCDAAPYFRIFNPTEQQKKFDPQGQYIKQWIPEINGFGYPSPIVDHAMARKNALETYQKALQNP